MYRNEPIMAIRAAKVQQFIGMTTTFAHKRHPQKVSFKII